MELTEIENDLMSQIFKLWQPDIDGTDARIFRVKNHEHLDLLDDLERRHILDRKRGSSYRVSFTCLMLVKSDETRKFIRDIDPLYVMLRNSYISNPTGSTKFSLLRNLLGQDDAALHKVVSYLADASVTTCVPKELFDEDVSTTYSEDILKHKSFTEHIQAYHDMWYSDKTKTDKKITHGNTEINASKREEVLGAAIAVIANYPKECTWGDAIVGKRVYKLIDEKALLWWPDGEVPLGDETSIELINKWLKTLK